MRVYVNEQVLAAAGAQIPRTGEVNWRNDGFLWEEIRFTVGNDGIYAEFSDEIMLLGDLTRNPSKLALLLHNSDHEGLVSHITYYGVFECAQLRRAGLYHHERAKAVVEAQPHNKKRHCYSIVLYTTNLLDGLKLYQSIRNGTAKPPEGENDWDQAQTCSH